LIHVWIAVAAGVVWFVLGIYTLVYAEKIKRFRIDITPNQSLYSGQSRWREVNVLSSANYSMEGQRFVRRLRWMTWIPLVPAGLLLYVWMAVGR
jgi:hypothetical protein